VKYKTRGGIVITDLKDELPVLNVPTYAGLFRSFLRLGLTAFGGPAMVAYIKDMSVHRFRWLSEEIFGDGVSLCQTIPGATAMQTAAYVGLRAGGLRGALASFTAFALPAFILMLILSSLYGRYYSVSWVASIFSGLQVVVVAIVANATLVFGRVTFKSHREIILAVIASALFGAGISPFLVILGAGLAGMVLFGNKGLAPAGALKREKSGYKFIEFSAILLFPFSVLFALYFADAKLFSLATLMMKIDLFAFGGGFASLPLMLHEVVSVKGWIDSKTFMDGIALGQVTPGPIVITSTFVGYMSYGLSGAIVATIAVFMPSFLLVVVVTPVFDRLKNSAYFSSAMKGVLASFVGLLFFVTVRFATTITWDAGKAVLACAAFAALFKKVDILHVVLISIVISLLAF
jgi:chromate transporter